MVDSHCAKLCLGAACGGERRWWAQCASMDSPAVIPPQDDPAGSRVCCSHHQDQHHQQVCHSGPHGRRSARARKLKCSAAQRRARSLGLMTLDLLQRAGEGSCVRPGGAGSKTGGNTGSGPGSLPRLHTAGLLAPGALLPVVKPQSACTEPCGCAAVSPRPRSLPALAQTPPAASFGSLPVLIGHAQAQVPAVAPPVSRRRSRRAPAVPISCVSPAGWPLELMNPRGRREWNRRWYG